MSRPAPGDRDARKLPIAPLLWAIGYSGLHASILLRAVMACQKPARCWTSKLPYFSISYESACAA